MFTGIVESVGKIVETRRLALGIQLDIDSGLDLAQDHIGDSIAVDGVCLTMTAIKETWFSAVASMETITRSTLGHLPPGSKVNIERALTLSSRLGGHFVLGHVDTVSTIKEKIRRGESLVLRIYLAADCRKYVVTKGSIAVDGVSLTVNTCSDDALELNLIPHTMKSTALTRKESGDRVNLEFDLIGKYVERLMAKADKSADWEDLLKRQGFI